MAPSAPASARDATLEQPRDVVGLPLEHRADERPHHVAKEGVGGDLEVEVIASLVPGRRENTPDEHVVLRLGGREGAEVVLAEQQLGGGRERVEIDPARIPPAPAQLERRARRAAGGCGSDSCASGPSGERGSRLAASSAAVAATSSGSSVFSASAVRSAGGPPPTSTLTTFPSACTPVSVRPATARFSATEKSEPSASPTTPSTVRKPGCAAQPWKSVPSYSSVSFSLTRGFVRAARSLRLRPALPREEPPPARRAPAARGRRTRGTPSGRSRPGAGRPSRSACSRPGRSVKRGATSAKSWWTTSCERRYASACRRAWMSPRRPSVIIFSATGRTAFAFATVVFTRPWTISEPVRFA